MSAAVICRHTPNSSSRHLLLLDDDLLDRIARLVCIDDAPFFVLACHALHDAYWRLRENQTFKTKIIRADAFSLGVKRERFEVFESVLRKRELAESIASSIFLSEDEIIARLFWCENEIKHFAFQSALDRGHSKVAEFLRLDRGASATRNMHMQLHIAQGRFDASP